MRPLYFKVVNNLRTDIQLDYRCLNSENGLRQSHSELIV